MGMGRKESGRGNKKRRDAKGALVKRKRPCKFCRGKINDIDFKVVSRLQTYITERGKILPRRISGNCAKHQRQLTTAVKRARQLALLPFTAK
ncbi:MAG: 30S ribosomal protein S18, partial [Nitrospirae bacterium]|nr:30S ribosomal protein S18 [Nitrospirota bacterium]